MIKRKVEDGLHFDLLVMEVKNKDVKPSQAISNNAKIGMCLKKMLDEQAAFSVVDPVASNAPRLPFLATKRLHRHLQHSTCNVMSDKSQQNLRRLKEEAWKPQQAGAGHLSIGLYMKVHYDLNTHYANTVESIFKILLVTIDQFLE
ncbi:hypothetical protein BD560DRAFT_424739 [Blakeslea trispora]|nr:hypothetical protein BD560DRAFT_424739 [Blakeslea trispora]